MSTITLIFIIDVIIAAVIIGAMYSIYNYAIRSIERLGDEDK